MKKITVIITTVTLHFFVINNELCRKYEVKDLSGKKLYTWILASEKWDKVDTVVVSKSFTKPMK